jgi:hypothetical protein
MQSERASKMQEDLFPTYGSEHNGLISVLYTALEGAWRCESYARKAEEAGDHVLAQFFREIQQEESRRAERARKLLMQRIGLIWDS